MPGPDVALRALAHPSRRALLQIVRDRECSVGDMAAQLDLAQPTTSQHLRVLRDAGLVRVRTAGNRRLYTVDSAGLDAVREVLADVWDERLGAMARHAQYLARSTAAAGAT